MEKTPVQTKLLGVTQERMGYGDPLCEVDEEKDVGGTVPE